MNPHKPKTAVLKKDIEEWLTDILASYEPRHVRDRKVIRDALLGFTTFNPYEINLIDSPLLQRLRRIHQTALASLVYPSATHSRFEHSLGVMAIADKMMRAVNGKKATKAYQERDIAEARLAALLHDCGHGPFSHASEFVYDKMSPELEEVRSEDPKTFGRASGHEILSYLIVTSARFKKLWGDICAKYDPARDSLSYDPNQVDLRRIGHMIVGSPTANCPKYLCQIINGPFDADKFDYILRDGYFSGLVTSVDIDRLAVSLDLDQQPHKPKELCMDIAGATILEQLLFSKMLLFSSMYHHHKVRAAFRKLVLLFTEARRLNLKLGGVDLSSAVGFLKLDDYTGISHIKLQLSHGPASRASTRAKSDQLRGSRSLETPGNALPRSRYPADWPVNPSPRGVFGSPAPFRGSTTR